MTPDYSRFPVIETVSLSENTSIRDLVDRMVDEYRLKEPAGEFGYRILLPRGDKLMSKAKKLGLAFQGEFVLALRKKHFVPRIRDVRYVHDEQHYGWILASPELYDRFLGAG